MVNTAGVLPRGELAETTEETIYAATDVNYLAPIFIAQEFFPHLAASRRLAAAVHVVLLHPRPVGLLALLLGQGGGGQPDPGAGRRVGRRRGPGELHQPRADRHADADARRSATSRPARCCPPTDGGPAVAGRAAVAPDRPRASTSAAPTLTRTATETQRPNGRGDGKAPGGCAAKTATWNRRISTVGRSKGSPPSTCVAISRAPPAHSCWSAPRPRRRRPGAPWSVRRSRLSSSPSARVYVSPAQARPDGTAYVGGLWPEQRAQNYVEVVESDLLAERCRTACTRTRPYTIDELTKQVEAPASWAIRRCCDCPGQGLQPRRSPG